MGPSYHVYLQNEEIVYEVYERAYQLHKAEQFTVTPEAWRRFYNDLEICGFWKWRKVYSKDEQVEGTTWYVGVTTPIRHLVVRGLNIYPPGFVEFLQALRSLLQGRPFA